MAQTFGGNLAPIALRNQVPAVMLLAYLHALYSMVITMSSMAPRWEMLYNPMHADLVGFSCCFACVQPRDRHLLVAAGDRICT